MAKLCKDCRYFQYLEELDRIGRTDGWCRKLKLFVSSNDPFPDNCEHFYPLSEDTDRARREKR